jgi:uncharacterized membrane protein HdeD (DUF308 family)
MVASGFHVSWSWAVIVLRGVVAIAAGIAAFTISADAAKTLLVAYLVVDGALTLISAARLHVPPRARILIAADGVIDLVVAVLLLLRAPSVPLLIVIVGLWAIATGILEVLVAVLVPRFSSLTWAIALVGVVSCVIGSVMLDWNNLAEIGLLYFFAAYAVIAGALFLAVGVALARAFHRERSEGAQDVSGK